MKSEILDYYVNKMLVHGTESGIMKTPSQVTMTVLVTLLVFLEGAEAKHRAALCLR